MKHSFFGSWLAYSFCPTLGNFLMIHHIVLRAYFQRAWFLLHCISIYGLVLFVAVGGMYAINRLKGGFVWDVKFEKLLFSSCYSLSQNFSSSTIFLFGSSISQFICKLETFIYCDRLIKEPCGCYANVSDSCSDD